MDANDPGTPPPTPQDPPASPQESSSLLLPSLRIENFRGFKELTIPKLGRVNLIVGKNGVGKSSLLEALHLYFTDGAPEAFGEIFTRRDEYRPKVPSGFAGGDPLLEATKYTIENLYHGRPMPSASNSSFRMSRADLSKELEIRFSRDGLMGETEMQIAANSDAVFNKFTHPKLPSLIVARGSEHIREIPLTDDRARHTIFSMLMNNEKAATKDDCITIPQSGLTNEQASAMWDRISLTNLEDDVVKALQIIAPAVQRLGAIGDTKDLGGRRFVARIDKMNGPIPLRALGDGSVRALGLALSLTCQPNRAVLIDEFENGLHWSVQSKVWEVVFALAEQLNVQVFATTHSYDCIDAFQEIANAHCGNAMLHRLEPGENGVTKVVSIAPQNLAKLTKGDWEVR